MVVEGLPAEMTEVVVAPLAAPLVEFAAVLNGAGLETVAETFAGVLLFPLKLINCPPVTPFAPGRLFGA